MSWITILFLTLLQVARCRGFDVASETSLRNDILSNYSVKVRPDAVTKVNLVFNLLTINELDTRTQKFSVSGFFTVVWDDSRLKWNRGAYNDIGFFFADETEVWRPSLVVKNAVDDLSVIANEDVPFRITDQGRVFWNPPGIYDTHCDVDITYYPFDTQVCSVVVQSWAYNLRELNLFKFGTGVQTNEFEKNGEWDLLEAYSHRSERVDDVDSETYAAVTFSFKLERKPAYYGINIILPVLVLALLSSLVFVLPADSGEKIGYSLTVLLSFAVFLTLIADRMPTTSKNTSFMASYLSVVLCLSGLSVLITIIILKCHHREDDVPAGLQNFTRNMLMPMLCMRSCSRKTASAPLHVPRDNPHAENMQVRGIKEKAHLRKHGDDSDLYNDRKRTPSGSSQEEITWKDVSNCLDALFFRVYVLILLVVSVIIFPLMVTGGSGIVPPRPDDNSTE